MVQKRIILGSGYAAVGYALTRGETLIVEEREQLDTCFCLPLRAYHFPKRAPETALGRRFVELCRELKIVKGELFNTGALEIALARLVLEGDLRPLVKCRVAEETEGGVLVYSNSGFIPLAAETVHDARTFGASPDRLTVLYEASDAEAAERELVAAFDGVTCEPTVLDGRYAAHIRVDATREPNALRAEIARIWEGCVPHGRIFLIAPTLAAPLPSTAPTEPTLSDLAYASPLAALEAGVQLAECEIEKEGMA